MRPMTLYVTYARKTLGYGQPVRRNNHAEAGKQAALATQLTGESPSGDPRLILLVTVARPEV